MEPAAQTMMMRLDKYLAHAGCGSRKEVKQAIRKGRVRVNDTICRKDDAKIQEGWDMVYLDGEAIPFYANVYIMLHKPQNVITATSDAMHSTVMDCIDVQLPNNCFPVGRLDIDTEGLVLITNDGALAHRLLSPGHHVVKTYLADIAHPLTPDDKAKLENGSIVLDEEAILPAKVDVIQDCKLLLHIQEGRFHQIKRMLHAVDNEVLYLKRIRMGALQLDETLSLGEWRYLHDDEIKALQEER